MSNSILEPNSCSRLLRLRSRPRSQRGGRYRPLYKPVDGVECGCLRNLAGWSIVNVLDIHSPGLPKSKLSSPEAEQRAPQAGANWNGAIELLCGNTS